MFPQIKDILAIAACFSYLRKHEAPGGGFKQYFINRNTDIIMKLYTQ